MALSQRPFLIFTNTLTMKLISLLKLREEMVLIFSASFAMELKIWLYFQENLPITNQKTTTLSFFFFFYI